MGVGESGPPVDTTQDDLGRTIGGRVRVSGTVPCVKTGEGVV